MTNQLTPLQCPGCGGLLRSLDARVWQCAYCESRYMLLGEETPVPGLARVVDGNKKPNYLYGDCWPTHFGNDQDVDPYTGMIVVNTPLSEARAAKFQAEMTRAINESGMCIPKLISPDAGVIKWSGLGWSTLEA